jgi:hypothetical protein
MNFPKLIQVGSSTTTRGRGPHHGLPQYLGLSAYVHWDGADRTAHTLEDTIAAIDPAKLVRGARRRS